MITEKSVVQKSQELLESVVDEEAILFGKSHGYYVGLNKIGTDIWAMLDSPILVSELINQLYDKYDMELKVIQDHVLEFLNSLYGKSFILILHET